MTSKPKITVLGGGIMGICTIYYLLEKEAHLTYDLQLVEIDELAGCASGKAGGFLASDWGSGDLGQLMRFSYLLHHDLSKKLNGSEKYGFRKVDTFQLEASEVEAGEAPHHVRVPKGLDWLNEDFDLCFESISESGKTSQVTPKDFCHTLLEKIKEHPVEFIYDKVIKVEDYDNKIRVILEKRDPLVSNKVIIALGPWSNKVDYQIKGLDMSSKISTSRGHSIIFKPKSSDMRVFNQVLFSHISIDNSVIDMEIYPRPDGSIYMCGQTDYLSIPNHPNQIEPNPNSTAKMVRYANKLIPCLENYELAHQQVCYLPHSSYGLPFIGPVNNRNDLFLITGHSVWGILNGPASGYIIACYVTNTLDEIKGKIDLKAYLV